MKNKHQAETLLLKYKNGTCTDQERAIVESWHLKTLSESDFMPDEAEMLRAEKAIWKALPIHQEQYAAQQKPKIFPLWLKYTSAAAVVLVISIGSYFLLNPEAKETKNTESIAKRYKNDVKPGGNKAVLTLADGRKVVLDDAETGILAKEGEASIKKSAEGSLVYQNNNTLGKTAVTNKLDIPAGGQYRLTLPDGTKVWLNSSSSLTYPTAFTGSKRKVSLSGEAYFEVAKDKHHPFIVETSKQTTEVLGTHFNINAYPTETKTKTTLLEGSVKVIYQSKDYLLKPGQQAAIGTTLSIAQVNTEEVIDWKNGVFNFNDKDLRSIMHLLERWYDIEVVYEGAVKNIGFGAEISRKKSLAQVLTVLEKTGDVKFKIQGRRVTVME